MSQVVGVTYKSRIPSLGDDATIEEALRVYHYGVDNRTTEPIPDDSIEGNFRTLNTAVSALQSQVGNLAYVRLVSTSATPNVVTGANGTTIPITVRAIAGQTAALQSWQNSSSTPVATMSTAGYFSIAGYASIGSTTATTTSALAVSIISSNHKGVTVKRQSSQTANIQEWQDESGNALSWVDNNGKLYYQGVDLTTETGGLQNMFLLMGA